ncbi:hypothetical protein Cha6605_3883 [Chamaesiphon minutus PCC 6605]|uniref:Uncharacterized protein n=2 Tax=Chamaesiphon TaxID=217161 RepID=K9UK97_CHAP6|nr:hypothetical protein Cha6605_3883 [Chamaesiphon minutus PCC 6605]
MKMRTIIAALIIYIADLGSGMAIGQEVDTAPPPWDNPSVKGRAVPTVYLAEWKKAENRSRCQPLVLLGAEREPGAKIRRAEFAGGWAVAYDLPGERSAFGIAGTGLDLDSSGSTFKFPNTITWSEGSSVSYGLQGGIGPSYLAYLKVSGQSCLYNIWSKRGKIHLEHLISSLRQVKARSR